MIIIAQRPVRLEECREAGLQVSIVINSISAVQNDLQQRNNQLIFCIRCRRLGIITNITPDPAALSPPRPPPHSDHTLGVNIISTENHQATLTDNPATPC